MKHHREALQITHNRASQSTLEDHLMEAPPRGTLLRTLVEVHKSPIVELSRKASPNGALQSVLEELPRQAPLNFSIVCVVFAVDSWNSSSGE